MPFLIESYRKDFSRCRECDTVLLNKQLLVC